MFKCVFYILEVIQTACYLMCRHLALAEGDDEMIRTANLAQVFRQIFGTISDYTGNYKKQILLYHKHKHKFICFNQQQQHSVNLGNINDNVYLKNQIHIVMIIFFILNV